MSISNSKVLKVEGWCSCEGCMAKLNKLMSKTQGVVSKTVDSEKGTITINGSVDTTKLVKKMQSKMKKKVTIMPSIDKTEELKKKLAIMAGKDKIEEMRKQLGAVKSSTTESNISDGTLNHSKLVYAHGHGFASGYVPTPSEPGDRVLAPVYAPALLSDENPSACHIQ